MASEDIALDSSSPEVTLAYYRHLYPFKQISAWLSQSHTPTKMLTHREFAFTLPGEVYLRYQSFANHEEFKKHVLQLNPSRFEIGPVYTARVSACKVRVYGMLTTRLSRKTRRVVDLELSYPQNANLYSISILQTTTPSVLAVHRRISAIDAGVSSQQR